MYTQEYRNNGIERLLKYQDMFRPDATVAAPKKQFSKEIESFISTFCEFQLADNDYMNLHVEAKKQKERKEWLQALSAENVFKLMTYIIWTDKFVDGYFATRISDGTIHELLLRLKTLSAAN